MVGNMYHERRLKRGSHEVEDKGLLECGLAGNSHPRTPAIIKMPIQTRKREIESKVLSYAARPLRVDVGSLNPGVPSRRVVADDCLLALARVVVWSGYSVVHVIRVVVIVADRNWGITRVV